MDKRPNRGHSLVSAKLFIEGGSKGADSKESQIRCREGFRKLLEKCGFKRPRLPGLIACGSRNGAFKDFKKAHLNRSKRDFIAMWIDSEDPLQDINATWQHLKVRDPSWHRPLAAQDEQVLFMTTCMETPIVADHAALREHYGSALQESALPPLVDLEKRDRHDIQAKLLHATHTCTNAYRKGDRSFEILAKLNPAALEKLPSFARTRRILNEKLK